MHYQTTAIIIEKPRGDATAGSCSGQPVIQLTIPMLFRGHLLRIEIKSNQTRLSRLDINGLFLGHNFTIANNRDQNLVVFPDLAIFQSSSRVISSSAPPPMFLCQKG